MKNITTTNYKGDKFTGEWNEKTYLSTIQGREDLYRIYVSNKQCHITKDELEKISGDIKKINNETVNHLLKMISELPDELRKELIVKSILHDEFLSELFNTAFEKNKHSTLSNFTADVLDDVYFHKNKN